MLTTKLAFHCGEALGLRGLPPRREGRVGRHDQSHSMRVVEQALPDQVRDVVRCLDLLAQPRNHGLKIERCHCIPVVRRRSQRA